MCVPSTRVKLQFYTNWTLSALGAPHFIGVFGQLPLKQTRSPPGLRPAHLAALDALARLSGATLGGAVLGSGRVTFEAKGEEGAALAAKAVVDAGTGGSRDGGWWWEIYLPEIIKDMAGWKIHEHTFIILVIFLLTPQFRVDFQVPCLITRGYVALFLGLCHSRVILVPFGFRGKIFGHSI